MTNEARKSKVVHFTIGEDMGIRLMEIAQEHLTYGNDPVKALGAITDSLIGCPTDYALKILKGDIVLFVNVENQTIEPTERIPKIHDGIFPKIDVYSFMKKNEKEILKHRNELVAGWRILENQIIKNQNSLYVGFDYNDIFKFISGNNDGIMETLRDLEELDQIGWVKIHDNNINYAGCLNEEIKKPNVNMTNVQVQIITNYINRCHNGIMRLGWKMERVSAARFEMTANNNMFMLNKNYFKF
jgi:hypothetical protein